ncbi:MAG: isoleucine--tRNA ligase [Candidatus Aenigmatarchaeota archaeon]
MDGLCDLKIHNTNSKNSFMFEKNIKKEEEIAIFWEKNRIYEKAKNLRKNSKKFFFLDGPPYATGSIHIGTAMNKILKDFYIRFFRMLGFNVWDQPGYDCHGVPIENKVEKKLGFKSKKDIEKFGVENFINECKKFATEFIDVMNNQFKNLGVWMNWKNPYLTLNNEYIEGAWFTFKKAFENGFLYKGNYPVHVCPRCETAVAYNEIEYASTEDPAIYVKFRIKDDPNTFLVCYTTTPWTIPANTGIMAKGSAEYVKIQVENEFLIIAKKLLEEVMKKAGIKSYKIIETIKGKELEGIRYEYPFPDIFQFQKELINAHRVILSEQFVSLEEGTGLVHTAPGHGQEDYNVGLEAGLPIVSPLKMDGTFDERCGKFSNMYVKDADKLIVEELKKRGLLLHEEKIIHEYPFCWRCSSPLILMAVPQWFFKITDIRKKLLQENRKIKWVPDWAGERFQNWLEQLGDWPISRQRYWGIPLPIWICDKCENVEVIGSRKELPVIPKDFHKPHIDKIEWKCKKCGGKMRRVQDVLDVWFDSGVAPWASLGYPKKKLLFKKLWPVDFILEGPDQIRGWWNSLMITGMMTFKRRPFNSVLYHGFVLDAHGVKMSKSKGNIVEPQEVINKYGRDILRFLFLSSAPWDDYWFDWKNIEKLARDFVIVRNTFNFVKTYVTSRGNGKGFKKEDLWILSRINSLIKNSTEYCKNYQAQKAAQEILNFILNDFSRWYIKIIRDRVWISYQGKDKKAAFFTLFYVAENLARLLSPFVPFFAEQVFQDIIKPIKKKPESIHLCGWPRPNNKLINKKIEEQMDLIREIFEACSEARQKAKIKLRWPIKEMIITSKEKRVLGAAKKFKEVLLNICNAKTISITPKKPVGEFSEAAFSLGKVLVCSKIDEKLLEEALIREIVRKVQEMRKKYGFKVRESISLTLSSDDRTNKILEKHKSKIKMEVGAKELSIGKIKGDYSDSIEFEKQEIKISFSKV